MKLVLFVNSMGFDVLLQAAYLNSRNIPFWFYDYNYDKNVFLRIETSKEYDIADDDSVLITLEDKGDFFGCSCAYRDIPGAYYPKNDEIRLDNDFIEFVEKLYEELEGTLEVIDIPKGERYRITEYLGKEYLELEKEVKWFIAD